MKKYKINNIKTTNKNTREKLKIPLDEPTEPLT
jgi:hypothetical protein